MNRHIQIQRVWIGRKWVYKTLYFMDGRIYSMTDGMARSSWISAWIEDGQLYE